MIPALLLAAGTAHRFGGPQKLLAPIPAAGSACPLIRIAAQRLLDGSVDELIVVLGREAERVRDALRDIPARFVRNASYAEGISTSLHAGVRAIATGHETEGLLIALGDQPLADGVVPAVVRAFRELDPRDRAGAIVVACYDSEIGHPVLFGSDVLPELLELVGDRGGRLVIERDPRRVRRVDFAFSAPPDVDTPDDVYRLIARDSAGKPSR